MKPQVHGGDTGIISLVPSSGEQPSLKEPKPMISGGEPICGVEPKELAKGELAPCLEILRAHNRVVDKHGNKSKLSLEKYREEFLSGRLRPRLSKKDETAIRALTEDIKLKVIAHHIKMVRRIANQFCRNFNITNRNQQDVVDEGGYALIKALYAYTNPNIYFSTFAHWVVTNTLCDYFRENHSGLSPVSKKGADLNHRIVMHCSKGTDYISFDQAVAELGLNNNQIKEALEAQRTSSPASAINTFDGEDKTNVLDKAICEDPELPDPELVEAFYTCDLTPLERAVMDAALNPWHGWMPELGRDFPDEDGKPRERQHIWMVLKIVQRKVQNHYENLKASKIPVRVAS